MEDHCQAHDQPATEACDRHADDHPGDAADGDLTKNLASGPMAGRESTDDVGAWAVTTGSTMARS
jgi:hypothetical protein